MESESSGMDSEHRDTDGGSPHGSKGPSTIICTPFVGEWDSWEEFLSALEAYKEDTSQYFVRRTSTSVKTELKEMKKNGHDTETLKIPEGLDIWRRRFVCTHGIKRKSGDPETGLEAFEECDEGTAKKKGKKPKSGARPRQHYRALDCEAAINSQIVLMPGTETGYKVILNKQVSRVPSRIRSKCVCTHSDVCSAH